MTRVLILFCLLLATAGCVSGTRTSFGPEDRLSAAPMGVQATDIAISWPCPVAEPTGPLPPD